MKFFVSVPCLILYPTIAILVLAGCNQNKTASSDLKTDDQKISYIIGINVGKGMKQDHFNPDTDLIAKGIEDAIHDKVGLSNDEMRTVMVGFQQRLRAQREAEMKVLGEKNEKEGAEFLASNKAKPGIQTTASGLQYEIISQGKGKTPKLTDTVSLNYRATLIDNTEFDNTQKRGRPMIAPLKSVMPGWSEALQLMKEGDKWRLFIPSNLAFGPRAISQQVGPNSTVIYEMELVAVNPPQPVQPMSPMNGRPPFQSLPPGMSLPPGAFRPQVQGQPPIFSSPQQIHPVPAVNQPH